MREILRKYIVIMFILGSAIMIFVNIVLDFSIAVKQQEVIFDSTMHQVVDIINRNETEALGFERELEQDYIIRARSVASILAATDSPKVYEVEELKKIANFLEIDEINIFDEKGNIKASTQIDHIGYNINDSKKSQEFLPLMYSTDKYDYYIQNIEKNTFGIEMKYIGVNSLKENSKGFIQIGLFPERVISYREKNTISSIFKRAALEDAKIMILDENAKVLGYSKNISEDLKSNSNYVFNKIKEGTHNNVIELNGSTYYISSLEYNKYLIVSGTEIKYLYDDMQWHILSIIISMIVICILGIIILDKALDKNIISNIKEIIINLNKIEKGDFNIRLEEKGCTELIQIESAINNMTDVLITMSNRLEKVIISTNLSIGLFEYIPRLNQIIMTNNIKEILSISDYDWEFIKNDPQGFKKLLLEIEENIVEREEHTYLFHTKFVRMNLIIEDRSYFGFIEDITEEIIKKDSMINELKMAQIKSRIDTLTGLLNKGAITSIVTEYAKKNNSGTLILFDLDNFKRVNDTKGHPEGDRLLKLFGKTIKELFRVEDYVARFGGDEFAVFICRQMSDEELVEKLDIVINKIREVLKEYYTEFHISVSIGAGRLSNNINSFEDLYAIADERLYKAKHNGKDNYYIE